MICHRMKIDFGPNRKSVIFLSDCHPKDIFSLLIIHLCTPHISIIRKWSALIFILNFAPGKLFPLLNGLVCVRWMTFAAIDTIINPQKEVRWYTAGISFFQSPVPRIYSLIGLPKAISSFRHFDFMSPSYCYPFTDADGKFCPVNNRGCGIN